MTAGELIEELAKFPSDTPVVLLDAERDWLSFDNVEQVKQIPVIIKSWGKAHWDSEVGVPALLISCG